MAITIMGGMLVATVLTPLVVPALYALWFRVRENEPAATNADSVPDGLEPQFTHYRIAAE
jgi:hypothetical protein